MANTGILQTGAYITLMSAELSGLVNSGTALSSAYDNSTSGYKWADFQFVMTGLSPSAGSAVNLYLQEMTDGTNFADTGTNLFPQAYIGAIVLQSGSAQRPPPLRGVPLPPAQFKIALQNGLAVALGSGNPTAVVLQMLPYTEFLK